jgi:hypothetical protein
MEVDESVAACAHAKHGPVVAETFVEQQQVFVIFKSH